MATPAVDWISDYASDRLYETTRKEYDDLDVSVSQVRDATDAVPFPPLPLVVRHPHVEVPALLVILLGNAIVLIPMILNAHAGTRYGISFPVLCRASFGVRGANIPAILRAIVACGWFGIQTWIGGQAIHRVSQLVNGGQFRVATPNAVAVVRGTILRVQVGSGRALPPVTLAA